jgi:hypothetical protein
MLLETGNYTEYFKGSRAALLSMIFTAPPRTILADDTIFNVCVNESSYSVKPFLNTRKNPFIEGKVTMCFYIITFLLFIKLRLHHRQQVLLLRS